MDVFIGISSKENHFMTAEPQGIFDNQDHFLPRIITSNDQSNPFLIFGFLISCVPYSD